MAISVPNLAIHINFLFLDLVSVFGLHKTLKSAAGARARPGTRPPRRGAIFSVSRCPPRGHIGGTFRSGGPTVRGPGHSVRHVYATEFHTVTDAKILDLKVA